MRTRAGNAILMDPGTLSHLRLMLCMLHGRSMHRKKQNYTYRIMHKWQPLMRRRNWIKYPKHRPRHRRQRRGLRAWSRKSFVRTSLPICELVAEGSLHRCSLWHTRIALCSKSDGHRAKAKCARTRSDMDFKTDCIDNTILYIIIGLNGAANLELSVA